MDHHQSTQQRLFNHIKAHLPSHVSLVDEIAELLSVSNDSSYRRIRGEKLLHIEEILILCRHFNLSFDTFVQPTGESISFHYVNTDEEVFQVNDYLELVHNRAKQFNASPDTELILITNDITIFQLLQFPELAAFKLFFWQKSSLGFTSHKERLFSLDEIAPSILETSKKIVHEYNKIKTTEIIGVEAITSFLRQVNYYLELGFFKKPSEANLIIDRISELIEHFHQESSFGYKYHHDEAPSGEAGNFTLYYNELFIIDGIVLAKMGDMKMSFIATGPMNFLHTVNETFYMQKELWAKNLMKRSILLSGISEKERNKYFRKIQKSIHDFKIQI